MSEREMLQKALTVSAMDYMKTETSSGSKQNEGKCQYIRSLLENLMISYLFTDSDDAYDSP